VHTLLRLTVERRSGRGRTLAILVVWVMGIGLASCNTSSGSQTSAVARPAAAGADSSAPDKVDLQAIFPPAPGRDLVLENCQSCHALTPIIVLQMDKDAWRQNMLAHRERVSALTDTEFQTIYTYLPAHFGPDHPVPKLPKAMLESWTSY